MLVFFSKLFHPVKSFIEAVVELFTAFVFGYFQAGLRGGINNIKWTFRGECARRQRDGLPVASPVSIDGIRMPFPWMDEELWRMALKR